MASTNTVNNQGVIGRLLSSITSLADKNASTPLGPRMSSYGETYVQNATPDQNSLAEEGSYYIHTQAPGAAALAYGVSASFSATAGFAVVKNTDAAGGRNLHMKSLSWEVSIAPASGTLAWFASVIDTGNRAPTANSVSPSGVNVNTGASQTGATVYFPTGGTLTVPAAVNASNVCGNKLLRAQIPVVGDEYTVQFGALDQPAGSLVTAAPAGASRIVVGHPPIVLAPGSYAVFYLWFPSNASTAQSMGAMECAYVMR